MSAKKSDFASATAADVANRELVISRIIGVPRTLVFAAFTDAKHISQWWGPNGFTTTTYEMNVRPGGLWRFTMHGPDGVDYPNRIAYIEIVKPERLVYDHGSDVEDDPQRFHVTVSFIAHGNSTEVILRSLFATAEQCAATKKFGAVEGGKQTLARLEEYLLRKTPD